MNVRELRRELTFSIGVLVGMGILSFGVALLILALSVGIARTQGEFFPPLVRQLMVWGGLVAVVGGLLVRLYRGKVNEDQRTLVRRIGTGTAVIGGLAVLVAIGKQTAVSAPVLTSQRQKFLLFLASFATMMLGWIILRRAASEVGY